MKRVTFFTVLALAALAPTFANAKPLSSAANDRAHYGNQQATDPRYDLGPGEIPYLSHGIGVNKENFRGSASATEKRVVIPYLSHGVGVTTAELFGGAADNRSFETPWPQPVVKADEGSSIDSGIAAMIAFAIVLGLLGVVAGVTIRRNRKTRLAPA